MNIWTMSPHERLRWWSNFREELNQLTLEEAVTKTNHLWSYAPYVSYYLHYDFVSNFPNPWELLYDNHYCDLAKALGIIYTLYLTEHKPEMILSIFLDISTQIVYNLVIVESGKYVCNMQHDQVVNKSHLDNELKLVKQIEIADLKLDQIQ